VDNVYEKFLNTFHRENQESENSIKRFSDFFKINENNFSDFNEKKISVTKLKDGKYFISNLNSKGFFVEKNNDIENVSNISEIYTKTQKAIGKVSDLFGFTNRYFENLVELFSNDKDSIGLGELTSEFLEYSSNLRIVGNIDIDNLFTIAYEANGNRILLDKNNQIYIYGHDLITHHFQKIDGIPKNTFYRIPKIFTLNDFVINFFNDFLS